MASQHLNELRRACRFVTRATRHRDDIIAELYGQGVSYRVIAAATEGQLSHGTVANIINRKTEGNPS